MSTVKPGVVGYLKTDDFIPIGSPYGVNQQPAAGTVVAPASTFWSSTPATDNGPGGTGSFMFLQQNTNGAVLSKVIDRNYIIAGVRAVKTGALTAGNDKATLSKVSADGLTSTTIGVLSLVAASVGTFIVGNATSFVPDVAFTANLAAGETLKLTATKDVNCEATVYIDVIGA